MVGAFLVGAGYYATKKTPAAADAQTVASDLEAVDQFEASATSLDPASDSTHLGAGDGFESASG